MSGQSEVYSATKDTLFSKNNSSNQTHALTLEWVYGRTPCLPVLTLQDHDQQVVLYATANVGVVYNHTSNSQHILQGHSRNLCALCVSEDKRWIATADPSPMVLLWDSYSGIPVCTLFDCHPQDGFTDLAFSRDAKLLVTLGTQHVCIWDWTNDSERPMCCTDLSPTHGFQTHIVFNSSGSELLSCSRSHVLLYSLEQKSVSYFALKLWKGRDRSSSLREADGALVQTGFHWSELQVLTATTGGSVVVWDVREGATALKKKISVHHLQEAPFTAMTVTDSYLVTGDAEGTVKFFGRLFVLLAFYSDIGLDPVSSISFSSEASAGSLQDCPGHKEQLFIRNFVASCAGRLVLHVNTDTDEVQTLLEEEPEPMHALCCHPSRPLLATGNNCGLLTLRDMASKRTVSRRAFGAEQEITSVCYCPRGLLLAVGFSSGRVHLLDSNLHSDPQDGLSFSSCSISLLSFSSDALLLAAADSGFAVTVFRRVSDGAAWETLGRHRSHFAPVRSLLFGLQLDSTQPRLLSLGQDRRLVEYDLERSSGHSLTLLSRERVEQRAVPLSMSWYPPLSTEQFILLCTDHYKLRLINSTTHMSRKLIRGPTYGSPLQRVQVLPKSNPEQSQNYYMAFTTRDMVGVHILPADGNPFKSQAVIAHPTGVSSLSVAYDGRRVVTAGNSDCSVMSWSVCTQALEASAALGGTDMEPFYTLLDGGRHGHFFREMEDLFFYIQIRHQGTATEQRRQISTTIPLSEVSTMMRAVGCFPTEQEIEDMLNEVKFSRYADTGRYVTELDLEDFIKLFLNHRPVLRGTYEEELAQAFNLLSGGRSHIEREDLLQLLQSRGETMTEDEVLQSFSSLLEHRDEHRDKEHEEHHEEHREEHHEEHREEHHEEHREEHRPNKGRESVIPAQVSLEDLAQILGFSTASDRPPST